jgi:hypothetical protein
MSPPATQVYTTPSAVSLFLRFVENISISHGPDRYLLFERLTDWNVRTYDCSEGMNVVGKSIAVIYAYSI